jgi:hypothetical protein
LAPFFAKIISTCKQSKAASDKEEDKEISEGGF